MENPELSSEEQSLKEKLDEHSKQLELSAEKFSQLELENLTLRDENQVPNMASNKKRCFRTKVRPMPNSGGDVTLPPMTSQGDAATCQKTKGALIYDVEDSESELGCENQNSHCQFSVK